MNKISETLVSLRKSKNITQNALASSIGVTAQTVSKWESGTNMPDILLLPVIADIFGVSVDYLFGRDTKIVTKSPDQAFDNCCDAFLRVMAELVYSFFMDKTDKSFDAYLNEYKQNLKNNNNIRSAVYQNHGILYYREELGGIMLKKPRNGWSELLKRTDIKVLLELLCSDDFRNAISVIMDKSMKKFTINSLCKATEIKNPEALEKMLIKSRMFISKSVDTDENKITIYELINEHESMFIFAILSWASEWSEYKCNYVGFFSNNFPIR